MKHFLHPFLVLFPSFLPRAAVLHSLLIIYIDVFMLSYIPILDIFYDFPLWTKLCFPFL